MQFFELCRPISTKRLTRMQLSRSADPINPRFVITVTTERTGEGEEAVEVKIVGLKGKMVGPWTGGRGSKNPKILRTSYMETPLPTVPYHHD